MFNNIIESFFSTIFTNLLIRRKGDSAKTLSLYAFLLCLSLQFSSFSSSVFLCLNMHPHTHKTQSWVRKERVIKRKKYSSCFSKLIIVQTERALEMRLKLYCDASLLSVYWIFYQTELSTWKSKLWCQIGKKVHCSVGIDADWIAYTLRLSVRISVFVQSNVRQWTS